MTTTTKTKWIEYGNDGLALTGVVVPGLKSGDGVKFYGRRRIEIGVFKRHLRKNACIILGGREFSIPYTAFTHYCSGSPSDLPIACNPAASI